MLGIHPEGNIYWTVVWQKLCIKSHLLPLSTICSKLINKLIVKHHTIKIFRRKIDHITLTGERYILNHIRDGGNYKK